jgi:hypothetical protein
VARDTFGESSAAAGLVDRALNRGLVEVEARWRSIFRIAAQTNGGEHELPAPLERRIRKLSGECVGEYDASESRRAISRVQTLNVVEMRAEPCGHGIWQHDASVLLSLAAPDCELATIEVHILDAKLETFLEAEAGAI